VIKDEAKRLARHTDIDDLESKSWIGLFAHFMLIHGVLPVGWAYQPQALTT
jgi:hypothetical protein